MKMTHQDIHDIKVAYVAKLGKHLVWPREQLWELVHKLWPKIQELSNENGGDIEQYRIQMSELANIISAIICGDHNVEFHTGPDAVLQTLPLIGMCSAVTSQFQPGYALAKIKPDISFKRTVPVGAHVTMTARKKSARGPVMTFELTAQVEGGQELFAAPRILTMFQIPDSPSG